MNEYNEQGERHGLWKKYWREDYWSDGNLKEKGNYLNGQKHGPWERYYSNGPLRSKGNYLNDKLDGLCENYDWSHGKLKEIRYYIT
jgi:antitoxin component YwqK of YwqJK toxin-antitoxin module